MKPQHRNRRSPRGPRLEPGPTGILLLDKPAGITSAEALRQAGAHLGISSLGHTGTLDPAATGLLVSGTGFGTRLVPWLQQGTKGYRAELLFGLETDSCDQDGQVTLEAPVPQDLQARLAEVLPGFLGMVDQVPPLFSAVRVNGVRAHELARSGLTDEVELSPRQVWFHSIEVLEVQDNRVSLDVRCSPGTYIRALARDLGRALGSAAHLVGLRRYLTGGFHVDSAVALSDLLESANPREHIRPCLEVLDWPRLEVSDELLPKVWNGAFLDGAEEFQAQTPILLTNEDFGLLGVGEVAEDNLTRVLVKRLLIKIPG